VTERERELLERLKRHSRGIRETVQEFEDYLAAKDEKVTKKEDVSCKNN
jgi:hypothetical protein